VLGSWPFIIVQSFLLAAWMVANTYLLYMSHARPGFLKAWDPYPFILLNLVLSFQAAYTGPVVMMSQNRQSDKDRLAAEHDFEINLKAEKEIQLVMEQLVRQDKLMLAALARLDGATRSAEQPGTMEAIQSLVARLDAQDKRLDALFSLLDGRK
jgi:uncharacterized membrane protein